MTIFPMAKYIHFQPCKLSPFLGTYSQSTHHMPHALLGAGDVTVLNKIDQVPAFMVEDDQKVLRSEYLCPCQIHM